MVPLMACTMAVHLAVKMGRCLMAGMMVVQSEQTMVDLMAEKTAAWKAVHLVAPMVVLKVVQSVFG